MEKINFRDEWISVEILKKSITDINFNEEDWLNKLIAWGETVFEIKKEEISKTYYIRFAGKVIRTLESMR